MTAGRSAGHRLKGVTQASLAPLNRGVPNHFNSLTPFLVKDISLFTAMVFASLAVKIDGLFDFFGATRPKPNQPVEFFLFGSV